MHSKSTLGTRLCTDEIPLPQKNPRSTAIRAVAKANELDLEIVEVDLSKPTAEYLELNKLAKVPTFVGDDGYVLYECIAIAIYSKSNHPFAPLASSQDPHCNVMNNPSNLYSYPCLNQFCVDILYLTAFAVIHLRTAFLHQDFS